MGYRVNSITRRRGYIYISIIVAAVQLALYFLNASRLSKTILNYQPQPYHPLEYGEVWGSVGQYISHFAHTQPLAATIIAIVTMVAGAIVTEQIVLKHNILQNRSLTAIALYIIFCAALGAYTSPLLTAISSLAMLLSIRYMLKIRKMGNNAGNVLLTALFLGLQPLIFSSTLISSALLLLSIGIMLCHNRREYIVLAIGFIIPTLIEWHLQLLLQNQSYIESLQTMIESFTLHSEAPLLAPLRGSIIMAVGSIASLYTLLNINDFSMPHISRIYTIIISSYPIITLTILLVPSFSIGALSYLAAPLAISTSLMLEEMKMKKISVAIYIAINIITTGLILI